MSCSKVAELDDNDEVPPLEDMSELFEQATKIRDITDHVKPLSGPSPECSSPPVPLGEQLHERSSHQRMVQSVQEMKLSESDSKCSHDPLKTTTAKRPAATKPSSSSFGGFKKGFLFSAPNNKPKGLKPSQKPPDSTEDDCPIIRPQNPEVATNPHQIKEVQEAMKASMPLLENKEWITEDLMKKLESNPTLLKKLSDPKFSTALQQVQTNPAAAEYAMQADPELQTFIQEFCGLLGEHFTQLGEKESQQKPQHIGIGLNERSTTGATNTKPHNSQDDAKVNEILNNPEMIEILKDPWVQGLMHHLRTNPTKAQELLSTAPPECRSQVRKLMDAGLLAFS